MTVLNLALVALAQAQNPVAVADTVPPASAIESPYTIRSGALQLSGTLTLPRGVTRPVPVAVIIAGSGPTDRNGNSVMGIRPNSYAQLGWRLAERGIATLRYDKRVLPGTSGSVDIAHLTLEDFAADARAAAESLAHDARFSQVVLLGHSEGSALAFIAARSGKPVAGVVSVAGLGRSLGIVMREQLARQYASPVVQRAAVPPGLRTRAARGQKRAMSNQCAAEAAVMRSTLESSTGGERCHPRSSAVEMAKRMGSDVDEAPARTWAWLIMPSDGSRPMAWAKCGASARAAVPGPQPTSKRVLSWPPVEVWWSIMVWYSLGW